MNNDKLINEVNKISGITEQLETIEKRINESVLIVSKKYFENKNHATALRELFNSNATKILFPKMEFLIDDIIKIERSDLEIDFNNSTLKWINENDLFDSFDYLGMIWCYGKLNGIQTSINSYYTTNVGTENYGVITVENSSNFFVGDFVEINCNTGAWDKDYKDLRPILRTLTKIVGIDGNTIKLEHSSPFDFSVGSFTGTLKKVDVVENVTIKNMNYVDMVAPKNGDDRKSWASAIATKYTSNFKIENIYGEKQKFPLIWVRLSRFGEINKIESYNSQINGPGNGYVLQNIFSNNLDISNIMTENTNPVVDLAGSSYASVRNCRTGDLIGSNFLLHGECEHDIHYLDCSSSRFNFGSGITDFPSLFMNVTIENCNIKALKLERAINVKLINCKGGFNGTTLNCLGLTIDKCDFIINLDNTNLHSQIKDWRNQVDKTMRYFNITNSSLLFDKTSNNKNNMIFDFNQVINISGNTINSKIPSNAVTVAFLEFRYCESVRISNNKINNTGIYLSYSNSDNDMVIVGNELSSSLNGYGGFNMINLTNQDVNAERINVLIANNVFNAYEENNIDSFPRALYINKTSIGNFDKSTNNLLITGNLLARNVISKSDNTNTFRLVSTSNLVSNNGSSDVGKLFL